MSDLLLHFHVSVGIFWIPRLFPQPRGVLVWALPLPCSSACRHGSGSLCHVTALHSLVVIHSAGPWVDVPVRVLLFLKRKKDGSAYSEMLAFVLKSLDLS